MISLVSSGWGLIGSFVVFVTGAAIALRLFKLFGTPAKRGAALYVWHSLFSIAYAQYVISNGGDAVTYYQWASEGDLHFSLGTSSVVVIAWPFVSVLSLPFVGVSLVFGFFGFIGMLGVDAGLRAAVADRSKLARRLAAIAVFLPSISFWSSSIGKDSLAFMATGLALFASLHFGRRVWMLAISIVVMFLVRPHIALLLIFALCAAMIMHRSFALWKRATLAVAVAAAALALTPIALEYVGLGSQVGVADLSEYVDQRQAYNVTAGAGLDLASMSLAAKLVTYIFRPLPYEATNLSALAASLDNVFLLLVFWVGIWGMISRRKGSRFQNSSFLFFFATTAWALLAITTANLGIAVRQKWMFLPMLLFLMLSFAGKARPSGRVGGRGGPLG